METEREVKRGMGREGKGERGERGSERGRQGDRELGTERGSGNGKERIVHFSSL